MSRKFIIQLVLILLVVIAFVSYIKPKFDELRQIEDSIVQYKEAVQNASQFTSLLDELKNRAAAISAGELQALEKFLPSEVDVVEVEQDIEAIALLSGLIPVSIVVADIEDTKTIENDDEEYEMSASETLSRSLESRRFTATLVGEYADFKTFLENLEVNAYPMRITSLEAIRGDAENAVVETTGLIFKLTVEVKSFDLINN